MNLGIAGMSSNLMLEPSPPNEKRGEAYLRAAILGSNIRRAGVPAVRDRGNVFPVNFFVVKDPAALPNPAVICHYRYWPHQKDQEEHRRRDQKGKQGSAFLARRH